MKPIPLKQIQHLIAQTLPSHMSYARKRVKIGKGKKKRVQKRIAGASDDKMFFITCYDSPVTRMELMVPFIPVYTSRTVAVIKAILGHFFPDTTCKAEWGDWLSEMVKTIEDNQKVKLECTAFELRVSRLDIYGQMILMFDIS